MIRLISQDIQILKNVKTGKTKGVQNNCDTNLCIRNMNSEQTVGTRRENQAKKCTNFTKTGKTPERQRGSTRKETMKTYWGRRSRKTTNTGLEEKSNK